MEKNLTLTLLLAMFTLASDNEFLCKQELTLVLLFANYNYKYGTNENNKNNGELDEEKKEGIYNKICGKLFVRKKVSTSSRRRRTCTITYKFYIGDG